MTTEDPFENPTPRVSAFASADSFRGRLVMIEPVKVERDIPKTATQPNGPRGDRVTATVTVVDGQGPIQIFSNRVPSGRFLDGPVHRGVWFGQEQLAQGLQTEDGTLRKRVLARIETLKPGQPQGQGNPWTFVVASDEDRAIARAFLAAQMVGGSDAPTAAKPNPFGN